MSKEKYSIILTNNYCRIIGKGIHHHHRDVIIDELPFINFIPTGSQTESHHQACSALSHMKANICLLVVPMSQILTIGSLQ